MCRVSVPDSVTAHNTGVAPAVADCNAAGTGQDGWLYNAIQATLERAGHTDFDIDIEYDNIGGGFN
jgi:hypothetical protein